MCSHGSIGFFLTNRFEQTGSLTWLVTWCAHISILILGLESHSGIFLSYFSHAQHQAPVTPLLTWKRWSNWPHHLPIPPTQSHWEVKSKIGPDTVIKDNPSKLSCRLLMFWRVSVINYIHTAFLQMSILQKSSCSFCGSHSSPQKRQGLNVFPTLNCCCNLLLVYHISLFLCQAQPHSPPPPVLLWLTNPTEQCPPLNSQWVSLIDSWDLLML